MTSVTCQTAYVKCFQWSSCCSCTRVGGDGSLSAGPKSLCWPQSRTALAGDPQMLVYVIHFEMLPRLVQSHKPLLLLIAVPAPTIIWMVVCSKTRTVETLCFDTSSEHFLRWKSSFIKVESWGFHRESWIFTSRVKPTSLSKVIMWMVDHASGGWECILRDFCASSAFKRGTKDHCLAVVKTQI